MGASLRPPRVLGIEHDPDYRAVIDRCIELAGAESEIVGSLGLGVRRLDGGRFDLIVWGVRPGEERRAQGVAQLRETGRCPLIVLDESYEEAKTAFEAGADQVLPKPFVPGALVGAIKAGMRSLGPTSVVPMASRIDVNGASFNATRRTIANDGKEVALTRREWELLAFMLANPNQHFEANELVRQAWPANAKSPEQLRSYVARLRRKLEPLELPCKIVSQQGRGYWLMFDSKSMPA